MVATERLGIVIIGYKNTKGIERLLSSIKRIDFEGDKNVTLIISIDYSGDNSVERIANDFEWDAGKKVVVAHKQNLGLRNHILSCGDYINEYNLDAIAVLEDDIYVSPEMYTYMKRAVPFYKNNKKIAGISLYKHEYNINARHPFSDYDDGGDTFFIQYAMSWGQIWIRNQWFDFKKWLEREEWKKIDVRRIPENILKWNNSWLKYHIIYCIDKDLYFVYPRESLTTNFTDVGAHNHCPITSMQVKMCMKKSSEWLFKNTKESVAIYDAFFESKTVGKAIGCENILVDLYGKKKYFSDTKYVLTRRIMPYKIIKSWGLNLRPVEANVFLNIPGQDIFLYDLSVLVRNSQKNNGMKILEYDLKGINIISIDSIKFCLWKMKMIIENKIRKMVRR